MLSRSTLLRSGGGLTALLAAARNVWADASVGLPIGGHRETSLGHLGGTLRVSAVADIGSLFVSYDLGVIRRMNNNIIVMHQGQIVEAGEAEDVFRFPKRSYTQALVAVIPDMEWSTVAVCDKNFSVDCQN